MRFIEHSRCVILRLNNKEHNPYGSSSIRTEESHVPFQKDYALEGRLIDIHMWGTQQDLKDFTERYSKYK